LPADMVLKQYINRAIARSYEQIG